MGKKETRQGPHPSSWIRTMLRTKVQTMVTCVDGQACCHFHGTVQCYRQMLRIAVTLHSNFLHLVTSSQTALVT